MRAYLRVGIDVGVCGPYGYVACECSLYTYTSLIASCVHCIVCRWRIQAVPEAPGSFKNRLPLPLVAVVSWCCLPSCASACSKGVVYMGETYLKYTLVIRIVLCVLYHYPNTVLYSNVLVSDSWCDRVACVAWFRWRCEKIVLHLF